MGGTAAGLANTIFPLLKHQDKSGSAAAKQGSKRDALDA